MSEAPAVAYGRWAARPVLGSALRLLALLGPVAVGFVVALLIARVLPDPGTPAGHVGWWVAVLGGSAAAVFGTDRVARRLLPLAILLELSLVFPDKAPSRLRAARTASVRDIDQRLTRLRGQGVAMQPYEAAETVVTLVGILGLHDKRTRGHSERVRAFTDLLTAELGLDEAARVRLRWAALVHDLGKLSVPAPVLNSAGGLDEDGWELMHRHPDEGVRLLGGLLPWLGEWGDAVGQHHERYDGTGYPNGLAGEQISYAGRIVALADSFEVMTSARSYKQPRSAAWARAELTRCAGAQFDPALVRAFLGISLGRLRWVLGPVTWLAELPFVATADRAGQTMKVAAVTALTAGLLVTGALPGGGPAGPDPGVTAAAADDEGEGGGGGRALPGPAGRDRERVLSAATEGEQIGEGAVLSGSAAGSPPELLTAPELGALPPPMQPRGRAGPEAAPPPRPARPLTAPRTAQTPESRPESGESSPSTASPPPQTSRAPASRPTPAQAAAEPASSPVYHLTRRGLQEQAPQTQEVVSVPIGGSLGFDRRLDRPVVLPAERDVVLFIAFPTRQGSAKVEVRLLDCASSGCSELSSGMVTQDKESSRDFREYRVGLSRATQDDERLPAGHVLRLEVRFLESGAKAPGRLALGSAETPSRLRLPADR